MKAYPKEMQGLDETDTQEINVPWKFLGIYLHTVFQGAWECFAAIDR